MFEYLLVCLDSNMTQAMNPTNTYLFPQGSKLCPQAIYLAQTLCNIFILFLHNNTLMLFSTVK